LIVTLTIAETLQAGLDFHRAGRLHDAERMYRRVLDLHPRHARAAHLLGLIAFQAGHNDKAVELLNAAIKTDRFDATFHADLAEIYRVLGRTSEATASCQRALELNPKMADVYNCLGILQQSQGDAEAAIASFGRAIEVKPNHAAAHANLGTLLRAAGNLSAAQTHFEQAVQIAPNNPDHYLSLGVTLYDQAKLLEAIGCYQKTLQLDKDNVRARYNSALARLALGDYETGWREFEARHAFDALVRRGFPLPVWHPRAAQTGAVLVHAEQGFGDALQFVRYVRLVERQGVRAYLDVHEELVTLFRQSGYANVQSNGAVPPECNCQIPLMSLPRVFETTVETIPAEVPYLSAGDELVARWRERLAGLRGLKVGIHWQGRPTYYNDRARSIPLAQFARLAAIPGVALVSLQKDVETQTDGAAAGFALVDVSGELTDFHETAAAILNLDLIIACDSAPAHLAGALGVPVWVGLTVGSDWRWMLERQDTPWYPTMRLFRQRTRGSWDEVFADMAVELAALARARQSQPQ
jgi:tetratricopeptide (TPR) repeat protein